MSLLKKSAVLSLMLFAGSPIAANAQALYIGPNPQPALIPSFLAPAQGPKSNYDPYTHGAAPCPEGGQNGGPKCKDLIPPG